MRKAHRSWEPLFNLSAGGEFTGDRSLHMKRVGLKQSVARRLAVLQTLLPAIIPSPPLPSAPSAISSCWSRAEEKMLSSDMWQGQRVELWAWGTETRTGRSRQESRWILKAISGNQSGQK